MSLDITPISDALGAQIRGLDLREPLDAATVTDILLLNKGQELV